MNRQCLRRLVACAVVGALGSGILLRLTAPGHIDEGVVLGALLGTLFCIVYMLYQCVTRDGDAECRIALRDSWFNRLCENHPLASVVLMLAYLFALGIMVRLVLVVLGLGLHEAWRWLSDAVAFLVG